MKNLHFYMQCSMVLLALCFAVQIPITRDSGIYVIMIEFFLGVYQMGMSILLISTLSRQSQLLQIHFYGSLIYILSLMLLVFVGADWMGEWFSFWLFVLPWAFAILFLVAIDELERARHYRL